VHIFHVITTLKKGGAESHLVDLCRALAARGIKLTVAFLKGEPFWVPELRAMGVETVALEARRYADPAAVWRLRQAIKRAQPDIVHAHMPPAELYAVLALAGMPGVPLVTSKHNDTEPFYRGPGADLLEQWCAARAGAIIGISGAVHRYFADAWPEHLRRKLVTVRYGLSPIEGGAAADAAARELRAEWGVSDGEVLFGIVGRLVRQKSIDTLLRAFARLREGADAPVKVAIVGEGELEGDLRALAGELGIADAVIWAGFRTDIPAVMRSFDVFVLSSIYEGFGLVLLEAMEASLPIVASGISAIPEIVVEGETGYLVPPQEPEALAGAMGKLLDRDARRRMGTAGHQRMLTEFVVDRMADETVAVYRRVLGETERRPR